MEKIFNEIIRNIKSEIVFQSSYPVCEDYDYGYETGMDETKRKVIAIIKKAAETAGEKMWTPAGEGTPPKDGFYIVTLDGEICGEDEPFVSLGEFKKGNWMDGDNNDNDITLAWQPLPTPYQPPKTGNDPSLPYKLKVYHISGPDKGNLDHEEFFSTKKDMDKRYYKIAEGVPSSLRPTAWFYTIPEWEQDKIWLRIEGY